MGKNLLQNPDFEDSDTVIDPWTSTGSFGGSYGINSIAKNNEPEHGDRFAYMFGGPFELGQQAKGTKQGETYQVSYYAYCWYYAPGDPNALCGWVTGFGDDTLNVNLTSVFNSSNLAPKAWPAFAHSFQASADNVALSYTIPNNTVWYIDNVSLVCTSCGSGNRTGVIVGATLGGIAGLGIIALGLFYLYLRRRRQPQAPAILSPTTPSGWSGSHGTHTSFAPSSSYHSSFGPGPASAVSPTAYGPASAYGNVSAYPTSSPSLSRGRSTSSSSNGGQFGGFPEMMDQRGATPAQAVAPSPHPSEPEMLITGSGQQPPQQYPSHHSYYGPGR